MRERRAPAVLAVVVPVAAFLAACQSASPASTTGPPSTVPATTTTTAASAPTLSVATWTETATVNWWGAFGASGSDLDRAREHGATASLFATSGLEPVAELAQLPLAVPRPVGEGWIVEQRIVSDRMWSDGVPIRASDLVFYFEMVRSRGLDGVHAIYFPPEVLAVEAVDDQTVRIRFTVAPGPGLWPGTTGLAPFVPAHFWADAVATDAPSLYAWSGASPPFASELGVEWVAADDREGAYRMLLVGEADFVHDDRGVAGLEPSLVDELLADAEIELVTSVRSELRVLAFNQRSAPLGDPAFRVALATVVDRGAMAETLGTSAAYSFTRPDPSGEGSPTGPGTFDGERLDRASRIDSALTVLRDAGYDPGSVRPFEILVSEADPTRVEAALAIAERIGELGLEVTVVQMAPAELADRVLPPIRLDQAASWDMAVLGWRPTGPDPGDLLVHLFGSAEDSVTGGGINVTGFQSLAFDDLASRYEATTSLARAGSILDQMELLLAVEVPQLPLYRELVVEATRSELPFGPVAGGITASPASWPYRGP